MSRHDLRGLVDPGYAWEWRRDRRLVNKALWMSGVGGVKNAGPLELDAFGLAEVN